MRKKFSLTPILLLLVLCLSVSSVLGAITFITPDTAGDTVTGTYVFNVTTALPKALNCSFSTTLNGVMNLSLNSTASQTAFWSSNATATSLTDAEDTTLTVVCANETATETNTLVINIDNTAPVCSMSVDNEFTEYLSATGITVTDSSTDTTDLTYSYILYGASGDSVQTSTSQNPSFSGSDISELGEYTLSLEVTDEASKLTGCTNISVFVTSSDDIAEQTEVVTSASETTAKADKTNEAWLIGGILLLVIVAGVVAVIVINNNKKGKKKR